MPGQRALLFAIFMIAWPAMATAQTVLCNFQGGAVSQMDVGGGVTILLLQSPFVATCDDGTELRASSGQVNQSVGEIQLVGDVYFQDAARTLTADDANYNRETGRLFAQGNVVLVDETEERRTLSGPELEYFRENETRPEALVYATRRPTLVMESPIAEGDETASPGEPLTLVGERIDIVGSNDLTAVGAVVITQADLTATAEEARYQATAESLELRRNAQISQDGYSLRGQVIQAQMTDGSLQHVHSHTVARLDGEDLVVAAPDIQLFFAADTLQQVIAKVTPEEIEQRARAASRTFRVDADSIDAMFTDGALEMVYAIGAARGETIDTTAVGPNGFPTLPTFAVESSDSQGLLLLEPVVGEEEAGAIGTPDEEEGDELAGDVSPDSLSAGSDPLGEDGESGPSEERIQAVTGSDWIRGDTIIAYFATDDSVAVSASDTSSDEVVPDDSEAAGPGPLAQANGESGIAGEPAMDEEEPDPTLADCETEPCPEAGSGEDDAPRLRKLVARRDAQSLYRLASQSGTNPDCRDLSFLVGAEIELDVVDGELEVAKVTGLEQGIYLEATNCAPPPAPEDPALEEDPSEEEGTEPADAPPAESEPVLESAMAGRWK